MGYPIDYFLIKQFFQHIKNLTMKIFIICAVWKNTKNNHAGMYYLAKQLKKRLDFDIEIIPIFVHGSRFFTPLYRLLNLCIGCYLYFILKPNDIVFLMEYLLPVCEQGDIARLVSKKAKVLALAHLIPARIEEEYSRANLLKKISYVDKLLVLGTSLKDYFISKGIENDKIIKTYHYVDNKYYIPSKNDCNTKFNVICMGNMERNYTLLCDILSKLPALHFHICMGIGDISQKFTSFSNVTLYGYMEEAELLELMQSSDVSLNLMNDTVGSNVITTSLASGLVVLASNVGSIGDYITDGKEGYLFNDINVAIEKLRILSENTDLLCSMKKNAVTRAEELSLDNFCQWFHQLVSLK